MSFILNDEQLMMQETARKFAEEEVKPRAAEIDESDEFPHDLYKKMAELGFLGITLPSEYGGAEADPISFSVVVEEISKASAAVGNIMCVAVEIAEFIYQFGTDEQKKKYVEKICNGELIPAFALTESTAGSDAGAIKMTAKRDGDEYVLNGQKVFITHALVCDLMIVFARTGTPEMKAKGISAFIVERNTPGLSVGKKEKVLGIKGLGTAEVIFDNVRVPASAMIGPENGAFKLAMMNIDTGRIAMSSMALGIAQAALDAAVAYAKEREQFGQPIANFQGIQFMLADMETAVEASRLLIRRAAYLKSQGLRFSKEASIAKLFTTDTAMKVATDALQIHGGYGYSMELPLQRYFRDAKLPQIYEGTNQIQRIIIARHLLK